MHKTGETQRNIRKKYVTEFFSRTILHNWWNLFIHFRISLLYNEDTSLNRKQ